MTAEQQDDATSPTPPVEASAGPGSELSNTSLLAEVLARLPAGEAVTHIRPSGGRLGLDLKELWDYRELVYFLFMRKIKADHRQMALGPLWLILRPVLSAVLYTLIFGTLAKLPSGNLPYALYNFSAVVLWTFFTASVVGASTSLLENRQLLGKVYFPRIVIPVVAVLSSLFTFGISFVILILVAIGFGYPPTPMLLLVPIYVLLTGLIALGIGLWFAPWVVHYRDVANLLDYGLLAYMYLCPIVYAIEGFVPAKYETLYRLNPMTNAIQGFRWCLLGEGDPPGALLALSFALALPLVLSGVLTFRRAVRSIVDVA